MLNKHRPTVLPGVPTLFVALINHPDLPRLTFPSCGPASAGRRRCPVRCGTASRSSPIAASWKATAYGGGAGDPHQSCGGAASGEHRAAFAGHRGANHGPETGAIELPAGEVGELVIKGPQVMWGYWQQPKESTLALRDGWLYTGDLARMDEDGYFYIVERKKDMIISGGYNIYPREVEEVLYQHPGVKEAVALGVPDDYRGELLKVVIVPQDGGAAYRRGGPGILPAPVGRL